MASAYCANIEQISYPDMLDLQKELAYMRRRGELSQDIVIFAGHEPTIAIGRNKEGAFSGGFVEKLKDAGKTHHEYFSERGLKVHDHGMQNSYYIGSGQFTAYFVNDYTKMLRKHDLSGYNRLMNRVILYAIGQFGIKAAGHHASIVVDNNVLATKAVVLSDRVASCGVQLHMSKEGVKHFLLLNSYGPVISIEDILGIEPLADDVRNAFLSSLKKHFGYSSIDPVEIYHSKGSGIKISKI